VDLQRLVVGQPKGAQTTSKGWKLLNLKELGYEDSRERFAELRMKVAGFGGKGVGVAVLY
jgi:hypothetical protein